MPIYEYRCPNGHTTEVLRSVMDRDKPIDCVYCGQPAVKKPFSRMNFVFTGFLRDDFWDDWEQNNGDDDYHQLRGETPKYGVGI